ncbi:porin [Paraburkholderia sp. J12]|uniref:porin n=1 Tax=Paraburkholderia sp. J12 TaxID=2805432 RepID=UPI002ABE441D|nr:porin [Paraburkholderia sp. J12]
MKNFFGMKVAIFAVGMAGSGLAGAQSSVTLYGVLDAGLLYTSKTSSQSNAQNMGRQFSLVSSGSSPSRFGLTGVEDVGGGMKVEFRLESGISVANGGLGNSNGNLFGRQAWVGLDSHYGVVTAGLQFSPLFLALRDTDPRGFSQFGSGLVTYIGNVAGTSIFNSNGISYTSPKVAGLEGRAMLALGGAPGNFQAGRQYSLSLKYENGNFLINSALYDGNSGGTVQTAIPTTLAFEGRTIGVSYKFGNITAKTAFVNYKVAGSFNNNVYSGGLDFIVTPQVDLNGGVWVTSDRDHTANHSIMGALGAQYFLSKRTNFYTQVGVVENHGALNTGLLVNSALPGAKGATVGVDLGIRHSF